MIVERAADVDAVQYGSTAESQVGQTGEEESTRNVVDKIRRGFRVAKTV